VAVDRIGALAEAGGHVALRDGHAARQQRVVDLAVEEQVLEHAELRFLAVELGAEVVDALADRERRVGAGRGLFGTAHRGIGAEIELAVVELADFGQAIAERVEARRLRLQLAELARERVEVTLGFGVEVGDRFALGGDRRAQLGDLAKIACRRAGEEDGGCEACLEHRESAAAENADRNEVATL